MKGRYKSLDAAVMQLKPHAIINISKHTGIYRGFSITKLPRKKMSPVTRYRVSQGDQSYGKFDAQAEATRYIDWLYRMRRSEYVKTEWLLVAIEGPTSDGRFIEAKWLEQAVVNFNSVASEVRVSRDVVHAVPPQFISEVLDLTLRKKDGKVALFAKLAKTEKLCNAVNEAMKNHTILYPSIELMIQEDDCRIVGAHLAEQIVIPGVEPLIFGE